MKNYDKTLVVNLLAGPGAGKSTLRAGIFYDLKSRGIVCEEAYEYAKELVWAKNQHTLNNQIHVFGEQHFRIWRLLGQVQVVVTDSPLILTPIYDCKSSSKLNELVLEEYRTMWNYNVFVVRDKPYNPIGRNQTSTGAAELDNQILNYMNEYGISYETTWGSPREQLDRTVSQILQLLNI